MTDILDKLENLLCKIVEIEMWREQLKDLVDLSLTVKIVTLNMGGELFFFKLLLH